MRKQYLFTIIYFISFINTFPQSLKFDAQISKNVFLIYEEIDICVKIKNTTAVPIKYGDYGYVGLDVFDSSGKKVQYIGHSGGGSFTPYESVILPNEEAIRCFDVLQNYGRREPYLFYQSHINTGHYTAVIRYKNNIDSEQIIKYNFEIRNPEGYEKDVWNKFYDTHQGLFTKEFVVEKYAENLLQLFLSNTNSLYAPLMLSSAARTYSIGLMDKQKSNELYTKLAEEYSWSCNSFSAIEMILKQIKDPSEKMKFIQKVKDSASNSIMKDIVFKFLEEK